MKKLLLSLALVSLIGLSYGDNDAVKAAQIATAQAEYDNAVKVRDSAKIAWSDADTRAKDAAAAFNVAKQENDAAKTDLTNAKNELSAAETDVSTKKTALDKVK